jgi:hypothetical protein
VVSNICGRGHVGEACLPRDFFRLRDPRRPTYADNEDELSAI